MRKWRVLSTEYNDEKYSCMLTFFALFPLLFLPFHQVFSFLKSIQTAFEISVYQLWQLWFCSPNSEKKKRRKCCESYMKPVSFTLLCRFYCYCYYFLESVEHESISWAHTLIYCLPATVRSFQFARTFHLFMNASDRKKVI